MLLPERGILLVLTTATLDQGEATPMVTLAPATVQAITRCEKQEDPFIFSTDLMERLQLLIFARKVLALAFRRLLLRLPCSRGRPDLYSDEVILVTLMVVWQLSPRAMARRLRRWPELAKACGYSPPQLISASQLYRRRDQFGLWVYFITFCAPHPYCASGFRLFHSADTCLRPPRAPCSANHQLQPSKA